ncbi:hypothetical protein D3C81_1648180 [compost metagenome]
MIPFSLRYMVSNLLISSTILVISRSKLWSTNDFFTKSTKPSMGIVNSQWCTASFRMISIHGVLIGLSLPSMTCFPDVDHKNTNSRYPLCLCAVVTAFELSNAATFNNFWGSSLSFTMIVLLTMQVNLKVKIK